MARLKSDMVDRFEELVDTPDTEMVEYLWPHVHPEMAAMERARKAVLITLASHFDQGGQRGRCHTLLVGPPGTGKTELRNWVKYNIADAFGIGQKSSEAGLKGDLSGGEFTPGALNLAHDGVLCIEELDKFAKSERDALYEAMSEGEYEVNQAEVRETYDAQVRVVATANGTEPFAPAVMDRFDFVIELDEYDAEETDEVTEQLYENWWETFIEGDTTYNEPLLPAYLKWIEPYQPNGKRETLERIHEMRRHLIRDGQFTGEIRTKEAYLRVAYTIAKLNRRDMTPFDFLRGIQLIHPDEANGSLEHALGTLAKGEEIANGFG